ncbi:hypothetical protein B0H14DRAFT_2542049 [Mycena olivaceomarginata]|nr:hypothetical protein B0H14DRAFT_2542049 [Mycena olivaceomarginata]
MTLTIRRTTNKDRVLNYGTVAATLLKDIGNASNQPYLQTIASVSLLIMETVQRVKDNKDACMQMTERAYELVCAIIYICRDAEAELAPAMVRSITQFSETLEKILIFVRNQVKGGFLRRIFRPMEDADLIKECNTGLKYALDVFEVQSGILAPMTMAEMQKDAKLRHEELIGILNKKRSNKHSSTSGSDGLGSSDGRRYSKTDLSRSISTVSMLPAPPKIFYGRDEEIRLLTNLTTIWKPARIAICGAEGLGKTAVALAASHSPEISQMFGVHRYFVECDGARDFKHFVEAIAIHLKLEGTSKKGVVRHLTALAMEETPVLLVLDGLDRAWEPHENRSDVEDFLSVLADLQHLTLIVTIRGGERPHQVKWTHPFFPTLQPLSPAAARATFLDISDADADDPALEELLELTENDPGTIAHMAILASFEGPASLVARWQQESLGHHSNLRYLGDALLRRAERLGDLDDINKTVAILRQATDLFPVPHPDGAWILKDLAASLLRRYEHNGDWRDILEARSVLKEALQRLPTDYPARPSTLKVLGDVLLRQFEYLGDLDDIQEALPILSEAVSLSPGIDPNNNLSYCLVCRFQRLGDLRDIQDALVTFESTAGCSDNSCKFTTIPSLLA